MPTLLRRQHPHVDRFRLQIKIQFGLHRHAIARLDLLPLDLLRAVVVMRIPRTGNVEIVLVCPRQRQRRGIDLPHRARETGQRQIGLLRQRERPRVRGAKQ